MIHLKIYLKPSINHEATKGNYVVVLFVVIRITSKTCIAYTHVDRTFWRLYLEYVIGIQLIGLILTSNDFKKKQKKIFKIRCRLAERFFEVGNTRETIGLGVHSFDVAITL